MSVRHLSQEWVELSGELLGALPARPGACAVVQTVVGKAPDGDVAFVHRFEDGRVVSAEAALDAGADVTLNVAYRDSQALARGELDVVVGVMRGTLKLAGDVGAWLRLMPVLQSEEQRAAVQELASRTDV